MGGGLTDRARIAVGFLPSLANPLTARMGKGINTTCDEGQTLIGGSFDGPIPIQNATRGEDQNGLGVGGEVMFTLDQGSQHAVAHSLRADGFDASEDGTGRGTPIIPIDMRQASRGDKFTNNRAEGSSGGAPGIGIGEDGDPSPTIASSHTPAVAFSVKDHGADASVEIAPTLRSGGHDRSHANGGVMPAIAFANTAGDTALGLSKPGVPPITGRNGDPGNVFQPGMAVRRLTPTECERLQGFPDGYTAVPYRNKPAADGPRYKALGNSMAVPCMAWIGRRVAMVASNQDGR